MSEQAQRRKEKLERVNRMRQEMRATENSVPNSGDFSSAFTSMPLNDASVRTVSQPPERTRYLISDPTGHSSFMHEVDIHGNTSFSVYIAHSAYLQSLILHIIHRI